LFRRKGERERGEILIQMNICLNIKKKKDEERYTQQRGYSSVVEHLTAEKVCVYVHAYTHQALNVGFSNVTSEDIQGDSFF